MTSVSVADMRYAISRAYSGLAWKTKVRNMPDDQVTAIYLSFCRTGKFDKPKAVSVSTTVIEEPGIVNGCSDTKIIYQGEIYNVYDITETSYTVTDEDGYWMSIPKESCEVI